MPHDPWRRSASPESLRLLFEQGVLTEPAARRALELATETPSPAAWLKVLRTGLLVIGSALVLVGVVFFFAWNWADLSRFSKLGVIAMGLVAAAAVGWQKSPSLQGHVALFAACVLEGALLAVYGQAYQTGADPYELFAGWMLVILPWVIAARTPAFFTLELVLLNVALSLFWVQVLERWNEDEPHLLLWLALPNALALAAWEAWLRWKRPVAAPRWFPRLIAAWILCLLCARALFSVVRWELTGAELVTLLVFGAAVAAGSWFFSRGDRQDLFVVAASWAAALLVIDTVIGRWLFDDLDADIGGFFLLGFLVLMEVGALVTVLRRLGAEGVPEVA